MPRRYIYKVNDLYAGRATSWARHYEYRQRAVNSGIDALKVLNALVKAQMPEPVMEITGFLYEPQDVIKAQHAALKILGLPWEFQDLMCVWYWTDSNWQSFVKQYQDLPDIAEDYYLVHDKARDGGKLVPMSSKPKREDVPKPVDKSRGKLGTSKVQVGAMNVESGG